MTKITIYGKIEEKEKEVFTKEKSMKAQAILNNEDFKQLDKVIMGFDDSDFDFKGADIDREESKVDAVWQNLEFMKVSGVRKLLKRAFELNDHFYCVEELPGRSVLVTFYIDTDCKDIFALSFLSKAYSHKVNEELLLKNVSQMYFRNNYGAIYMKGGNPRNLVNGALA